MTDRITNRNLEAVVARINRTFNEKEEAYTREPDGTFHANIGTFTLDGAYGGVALFRIMNEGGGVTDVLRTGHTTKRNLYDQLFAFLAGVELWDERVKANAIV